MHNRNLSLFHPDHIFTRGHAQTHTHTQADTQRRKIPREIQVPESTTFA